MANKIFYQVKATPNSKQASIVQDGNFLQVSIDAPPIKGMANRRLIEILSKYFKVSQNCIKIISGYASRNKFIEVSIE